MPYIPEKHKKYNLLPWKREHGGEVFEYPSLLNEITKMLPEGETLDPYGYDSYEQYYSDLDLAAKKYAKTEKQHQLFDLFKAEMEDLNQKECWSILRYIGKSDDRVTGIKQGHVYYWPCSQNHPSFCGVIDEEEYTSYLYPTEPEDWEILEDPTGMAYNTLHHSGKDFCSKDNYENIMKQIKQLFEE